MSTLARLSVSCPDQRGIVAAVTSFLHDHGANISTLDQHATGHDGEHFFMRLAFEIGADGCDDTGALATLEQRFGSDIAPAFNMQWRLSNAANKPKIAIFVSKTDHCVLELLWRCQRGELPCEIAVVISNHESLRQAVEGFGVRFEYVPVTAANKLAAEAKQHALVEDCDLLVLARYMQILSPSMAEQWQHKIINIHHSFLPAFVGANPYQQAWSRGVKIIGATAHYVTSELDEGPIIEQAVGTVSHRDSVADLKHLGQELERKALYQAVRWHLEERIVIHGRRTVVFR